MVSIGNRAKIKAKVSKLLSASLFASALPLLVLGNLVGSSSAANANLIVDAGNATFQFLESNRVRISGSSTDPGRDNGDVVRYNNVQNFGGISIDAVVRTTLVTSSGAGPRIENYDVGQAGAANYIDLDVRGASGSNFHGYINLNFTFFESGTFTGDGTGNQITLQNVSVFSLDVDSTEQFTDFRGFQTYKVNQNTLIRVGSGAGNPGFAPYYRFLSGIGAGGNNESTTAVQVDYFSVNSLDVRVGNASSGGGAYFAVGFGAAPNLGITSTVSNPVNAPPTASSISTLNVPTSGNFSIEKRHFGTYSDPDGNAFDKVQITGLPTSGTLQRLSSGSWVPVSLNDFISISAIDAGELRLVMSATSGTSDSNMKFRVNDSLASSTAEYTLALNVSLTPQTINFPNPGTRQLGAPGTVTETATANSGLATTLTISTPGVCEYDATTGHILNKIVGGNGVAGSCTVMATQDGNSTFSAAPSVTQTFFFSANAAQTIDFLPPTDKGTPGSFTAPATSNSTLVVVLTSLTPAVCTVLGFVTTLVSTGTCQLRATQSGGTVGSTTFGPASPVTRSFNVSTAAAQTITFNQPTEKFVADDFASGATANSTLIVSLTSSSPGICTVSGLTISAVAAGSCTIVASQSGGTVGSTIFGPAASVTNTFNISPRVAQTAPIAIQTSLVFFLHNGADSTSFVQAEIRGDSKPLMKNTMSRSGYTFTGWNTSADGSGTAYSDGALFAFNAGSVPLYAQWKLIQTSPRISWATPLTIQEGTPLSTTQLNATGSVSGTFSYQPPSGSVLPVGRQILKVFFSPSDAQFSSATAEVVLEVIAKPVVIPSAPINPIYVVAGSRKSLINWGAGANANSYTVVIDGKNVCDVFILKCEVAQILGPKNRVMVTSNADSGKSSSAVMASYRSPQTPQVITVVNFDTAKATLKRAERAKLRAFASQVNAAGFTTLGAYGHTDSVGGIDNKKLSIARANSTIAYLQRLLPQVRFVVSGFAAGEPVADNATTEGKAANRRAEVFIP